MGRARRGRLQSHTDGRGDGVIADLARGAGARLIIEPFEPIGRKAPTPFADRIRVGPDQATDVLIFASFGGGQNDAGTSRQRLSGLLAARQAFKFDSLRRTQINRSRRLTHPTSPNQERMIIWISRSGH
jgi:hypothetical protein